MGAPKEWPPLLMGYDVAEEIRVVRNGQGVPATQPIPPDAQGHVPGLDIRPPYDPAAARALLDKFGYRDRDGDGWRERPDGQPLVLHIGTTPEDRERDDLFARTCGRSACASSSSTGAGSTRQDGAARPATGLDAR